MIPAPFDYQAPATLEEAVSLLASDPDGAKVLAGGHSLIPAMKLRLAQPQLLVDIARIKSLSYIREEGDQILIGATTTHSGVGSVGLPMPRSMMSMPATRLSYFILLMRPNR